MRLSDRGAELIAGLRIEGAATPSDELRAILARARLPARAAGDFESLTNLLVAGRAKSDKSEGDPPA